MAIAILEHTSLVSNVPAEEYTVVIRRRGCITCIAEPSRMVEPQASHSTSSNPCSNTTLSPIGPRLSNLYLNKHFLP